MGDRPSIGETTIQMTYTIVSEGEKDSSTEVEWPFMESCLDKLA